MFFKLKKEIMYWLKSHKNLNMMYLDHIMILISFLFLALFLRADLLIISIFLFLIPYSYFTNRVDFFQILGVSLLVSLAWMGLAKEMYHYGNNYLVFYGINMYTLFSWACGLFALFVTYLHYEKILQKYSFFIK